MITLFGFNFHLYGFLIGIGILASASASVWLARRRGLNPDIIWNGLWWVLIPAIVGARLYHVADRWDDIYRFHPASALYLWNGGLGIFGALVGGAVGLFLYYRRLKLKTSTINNQQLTINNFFQLLDLVFFGLPLGQAIGRLGNWINQEVYGLPTNLPWGIYIRSSNRLSQFSEFSRFHPLFAYEAVWNLLGFLIMLLSEKLYKRKTIVSPLYSFTGFYLAWYGLGRFLLDFLRPAEFTWDYQNTSLGKISALTIAAIGVAILFRKQVLSLRQNSN